MYRPDLHLGALRGPLPRSPLHVLRTYLAVTTLLYAVGVALTLFPADDSATLSDPTGGLVAVVLGLAALTAVGLGAAVVAAFWKGGRR